MHRTGGERAKGRPTRDKRLDPSGRKTGQPVELRAPAPTCLLLRCALSSALGVPVSLAAEYGRPWGEISPYIGKIEKAFGVVEREARAGSVRWLW